MLENVVRRIGLPIDDVLRLQSLQRRADVIFRFDDKREQIRVEPPADSRRGLQQRTVFRRQPIHSGREQTLYACRQTVHPDRGVEIRFTRGDAQRALFDQEAQDFLAEERIAPGPLRHLPHQRVGQGRHAELRLQDMLDVARGEGLQRKGRHAQPSPPVGKVFGSRRMNDKQVRLLVGLDQFAEHLFGRTVDPMDVLDHHNNRGRPASRFQKRRQQLARAQTDQNAVESRQRGFRRLQTQQIKQQAQILRRMKLQPAKTRIQLSRDFGRIVLGSDPESAAHDLKERQKRNLLAVGRAMPDEDEGLVGLKAVQKFRHEARLA